MFIEEEVKEDKRPFMAVCAPGREFVLKYFDRAFDCRITDNPDVSDSSEAVVVMGADTDMTDRMLDFVATCKARDINVTVLKVPYVIGTGMDGLMLRMARGISRGFHAAIKGNETRWSVIHATDVAGVALCVARSGKKNACFTVSAPPIGVSDLQEALSFRIKNKRLGKVSPRWAKIIYGSELYALLNTDRIVDTTDFEAAFPEYSFSNPAEYLKTHVYDDESL